MKIFKDFAITIVGTVLIFFILKFTGLGAGLSSTAQTLVMQTGLLNAAAESEISETFNYDFSLTDLNGQTIRVDQLKGKVIFLNLWATWCAPCKAEMAGIHKLYQEIATDDIAFVMLSLDKAQDKEKVKKYIYDKKFAFPVYLPTTYLPDQLIVPSIPTTFIIDKRGNLVAKEIGTTNFNTKKFKKFIIDLSKK
jgi:thiol-disulfide isomerase/thioredoxin